MNGSIPSILLALLLVLAGCAVPPGLIPPPLELPRKSAQESAPPTAPSPGGETGSRISATPSPPPLETAPPEKPAIPAQAALPEVANLTLAFDQVPLPALIQVVYGKSLKKNVALDPAIAARKDIVTLRTGTLQTPSQVEATMQLLLKSYGISVAEVGNLVRVAPDGTGAGYLPEIRLGRALPETPVSLRPVFQLVELNAVRVLDVAGWLKTMFDKRVDVKEDPFRNALLLGGAPGDVRAALEVLEVLDQPFLKGRRSVRITPVYWSVDELGGKLTDILTTEGYGAGSPKSGGTINLAVVLLPVAGANAIFVFAADEKILNHVVAWAKELDRPNDKGGGRNLFSYRVQSTDAESLAKTLQQLLTGPAVLPASPGSPGASPASPGSRGAASVIVDKASNTLIFQGRSEDYGDIRNLLQALDRPAKGALIEVTVAEVTLTDNSQLGVEWLAKEAGLSGDRSATYGTLGGLSIGSSGFNYSVFDNLGNLRLVLNALASTNKATILSSPRLLARNGETAVIQVGQEVPIITSQQVAAGTTGGILPTPTTTTVPQTIQYRNTGVILTVKPVIYSGDRIDLDVSQEVSAAQSTTTGVSTSPTFSTRKVQTRLSLKNGATVLLGGLISSSQSEGNAGIPFLKEIPILGQAFRTDTGKRERTELIVLITPYVIADDSDAQEVTEAFRKQLGGWAGERPAPAGVAPGDR